MTATLLPIPDDPRFAELVDKWPQLSQLPGIPFPRAAWLKAYETLLREFYPQANSDSLTLTARHSAPFPLAAGPNVP